MKIKHTFNEMGHALTTTQSGIEIPANLSFECINDFVHRPDANYEELESLCLGMAATIEKLTQHAIDCCDEEMLSELADRLAILGANSAKINQ